MIGAKTFSAPQTTRERLMTPALRPGSVAETSMMSARGITLTSLLLMTKAGISIHQSEARPKISAARAVHAYPASITLLTEYLSAAQPSGTEARELTAPATPFSSPSSNALAPRSEAKSRLYWDVSRSPQPWTPVPAIVALTLRSSPSRNDENHPDTRPQPPAKAERMRTGYYKGLTKIRTRAKER